MADPTKCTLIFCSLLPIFSALPAIALADDSDDDPKPTEELSTAGYEHARDFRAALARAAQADDYSAPSTDTRLVRATAAPGTVFDNPQEGDSGRRKGTLSKEALQSTVRRHLPEIKFCFDKELKQNPDVTGRVYIHFTISATGEVTRSDVQSSTVDNSAVEQCLASAVRRWPFPRPAGDAPVTVDYPFTHAPTH